MTVFGTALLSLASMAAAGFGLAAWGYLQRRAMSLEVVEASRPPVAQVVRDDEVQGSALKVDDIGW